MVKPFFDMENWENNAFKSRKYSILYLLLSLKVVTMKWFDLLKLWAH